MRPLLPLDTLKTGPACRYHKGLGIVGFLRSSDGKLGCVYCLHALDLPPGGTKIFYEAYNAPEDAGQPAAG